MHDAKQRKLTEAEASRLGFDQENDIIADAGMTEAAIRAAASLPRAGVMIHYRDVAVAVSKDAVALAVADVSLTDEDERPALRARVQKAMNAFIKHQAKLQRRGRSPTKEAFDAFYGDALIWHALLITDQTQGHDLPH